MKFWNTFKYWNHIATWHRFIGDFSTIVHMKILALQRYIMWKPNSLAALIQKFIKFVSVVIGLQATLVLYLDILHS